MIKKFKDYYQNKKVKSDNISKLLTDFRGYYREQKFNLKKLNTDFKNYYNKKKVDVFIEENDYDELLIQFDKLDYKVKDELSKK